MIRLLKDTSLFRFFAIDDRNAQYMLPGDAKAAFVEELAALLHDQSKEGFHLGGITTFQGEQVVILAPRPALQSEPARKGGFVQTLKDIWR